MINVISQDGRIQRFHQVIRIQPGIVNHIATDISGYFLVRESCECSLFGRIDFSVSLTYIEGPSCQASAISYSVCFWSKLGSDQDVGSIPFSILCAFQIPFCMGVFKQKLTFQGFVTVCVNRFLRNSILYGQVGIVIISVSLTCIFTQCWYVFASIGYIVRLTEPVNLVGTLGYREVYIGD